MKKALIIGATSGMGKGLALRLVADGYRVGILGRRKELLERIKQTNPTSIVVSQLDVKDCEKTIETLDQLLSELGEMDLAILCAGIGDLNPELDFEIEVHTIETNVMGFTCVVDWCMRYFEKRGHGHLVAISSIGGIRGSGVAPAYNATKAYQINYLEGLRQRVTKKKLPITITDIRPGLVKTEMAKGEALFWVAPVDKAVQQIYGAIKKRRRVAIVTKRWRLISCLLRILPGVLYEKL